jgi:hypothetical protein
LRWFYPSISDNMQVVADGRVDRKSLTQAFVV